MNASNINTDKLYLIAQIGNNDIINELKNVLSSNFVVPEWQKIEVRKRLKDNEKNPNKYLEYDVMMEEIENEL